MINQEAYNRTMTKNPPRLSFRSLRALIEPHRVSRLYFFSTLRVLTNFLDAAGVIGLALLVATLSAGFEKQSLVTVPLFGTIAIPEQYFVLASGLVLITFLLKSGLSILLRYRTALFLSDLEISLSGRLANDFFAVTETSLTTSAWDGLSGFQTTTTSSIEGLILFLNARISAITDASLVAVILVTMAYFSPGMTLVVCLYTGVTVWALKVLVTDRIKKVSGDKITGLNRYLSTTRDLFSSKVEMVASGAMDGWLRRVTRFRTLSASSNAQVYFLTGTPRFVLETSLILGLFLLSISLELFNLGESQFVILAVFAAGGLRLVAALVPLQASLNQMVDGEQKAERAVGKLRKSNTGFADHTGQEGSKGKGPLGLEFVNVSFEYDSGTPVLRTVSFRAVVGGRTALVGPSGAGKSTCFQLAIGAESPGSGKVLLGGESPISQLRRGDGTIGVVPQRPSLVSGTLAENISLTAFANSDLPKVRRCLELSGLERFSSEGTLEMNVEPDSGQFSGGEIQRISLARALYGEPRILFLDEATSSLDAQTESAIGAALDKLKETMTVVLIAHRLTTVKNADHVIYLSEGRVEAQGSFEFLVREVPDFKRAAELLGAG